MVVLLACTFIDRVPGGVSIGGKAANYTVYGDDPYACPCKLRKWKSGGLYVVGVVRGVINKGSQN